MELIRRSLKYFATGIVIGILAWILSDSNLPIFLLRLATGLSWIQLLTTGLTLCVVFAAIRDSERFNSAATLAVRYTVHGLARSVAVLLGACLVALTCWLATRDNSALETVFYGSLLIAALTFFARFFWSLEPRQLKAARRAANVSSKRHMKNRKPLNSSVR